MSRCWGGNGYGHVIFHVNARANEISSWSKLSRLALSGLAFPLLLFQACSSCCTRVSRVNTASQSGAVLLSCTCAVLSRLYSIFGSCFRFCLVWSESVLLQWRDSKPAKLSLLLDHGSCRCRGRACAQPATFWLDEITEFSCFFVYLSHRGMGATDAFKSSLQRLHVWHPGPERRFTLVGQLVSNRT